MAEAKGVDDLLLDTHVNSVTGLSISLTKDYLSYGKTRVALTDLLGASVSRNERANSTDLVVHGFPKVKKLFSDKRRLVTLKCGFVPDDGEAKAEEWKRNVLVARRKAIQTKYGWYEEGEIPTDRPLRYLVLINPAGGKGNAVHIYRTQVEPLFALAHLDCNVVVTEHAGHAKELVRDYDMSTIDGIVFVSGDGLLYEIINGIMERPDWSQAITIPIAVLPTGSGNALCASLLFEAGEKYSVENAAFQIICGAVSSMDLLTAHTMEGIRHFSLLANWGMIADLDIESEKYRRIGEIRFTLGAFSCILNKKIYRGKVSYLPLDTRQPTAATQQVPRVNGLHTTTAVSGDAHRSSDQCTVSGVKRKPETCEFDTAITEVEHESVSSTGAHTNSNGGFLTNGGHERSSSPTAKDLKQQCASSTASSNRYGPSTPLLPSLSDPVPPDWVTIDDGFVAVTGSCISLISHDFFISKTARVGGGVIHLVYTLTDTSRGNMLTMMNKMTKGSHTQMSNVHTVETTAFRVEPAGRPGTMTLDGELISYGPLQVQIHPQMGRVLGRRPRPSIVADS